MTLTDQDFLAQAMQGVQPLKDAGRVVMHRPGTTPHRRRVSSSLSKSVRVTENLSDNYEPQTWLEDPVQFVRQGYPASLVRQLKRGVWTVQRVTDLHGMSVSEARSHVVQYLQHAIEQSWRCVQIIHGKGYGSREGVPLLKHKLFSWLVQHHSVLAFCAAPVTAGGSGAVMILLKKAGR